MPEGRAANYMRRAIEIARRGEGATSPNPMVGCVIVKNDCIIGEGWHERCGMAHAEINALRAAGPDARGAEVFVSLEPCAHTGRTGPCADALIDAGVASVRFAMRDPTKQASGGADKLRAAGIAVAEGPCGDEARALNRAWRHALRCGRPYVTEKIATSLDGKMATRTGDSKWITNETSRRRGHDLRKINDAVLVGANTVIADDPALSARDGDGRPLEEIYQPVRIVLDSAGRTDPRAKVYSSKYRGAILAATERLTAKRRSEFEDAGVAIFNVRATPAGQVDLNDLLEKLGALEIRALLVEGGGQVAGSFLAENLVSELWAFIAAGTIIGAEGIPAIGWPGPNLLRDAIKPQRTRIEQLDGDVLVIGEFGDL